MAEEWKKIEGFNNYSCTKTGKIRNDTTQKILTYGKKPDSTGYITIDLKDDNGKKKHLTVHQIIAQVWLPNPYNKKLVDHIDNDNTNNDVTNLKYKSDTKIIRIDSEMVSNIESNKPIVKKTDNVKKIVRRDDNNNIIKIYNCLADAGEDLGYHESVIDKCCTGKIILYDEKRVKINLGYKDNINTKSDKPKKGESNIKKIVRFDNKNNIMEIYDSAVDAGKQLDYHENTIRKCCKGKAQLHEKDKTIINLKYLSSTDNLAKSKIDPKTIPEPQYEVKEAHGTKVIRFDNSNNIIKVYDSISEATEDTKLHYRKVNKCCEKNSIIHKDGNITHHLKFLEPTDDLTKKKIDPSSLPKTKPKPVESQSKKVSIYKGEKLLGIYNSMKEAAQDTGINRNTIARHCNGDVRKPFEDYKISYVTE